MNISAEILLILRDRKADTVLSILEYYGIFPGCRRNTLINNLEEKIFTALDGLKIAGFISFETRKSKIVVSDLIWKVQASLGFSLKELAEHDPERSMVVSPVFGKAPKRDKVYDIFVLMPFKKEFKSVYDVHLKGLASAKRLLIARADNFFSPKIIIDDIWELISTSKVIVADCTGRNPNVFYEMGIAHAIGKPLIMLTQNSKDIPFDVQHRSYIKYSTGDNIDDTIRDFHKKLEFSLHEFFPSHFPGL